MIDSIVCSWIPKEEKYIMSVMNTNLSSVYVEKFSNLYNVIDFLQIMMEKDIATGERESEDNNQEDIQ